MDERVNDRFQAMTVFVAVVETGSFSAAAKRLNMGQPAVSKAVAALEDRLGVGLLTRTTRSHSLTAAGERFLERATAALAQADAAEAEARAEMDLLKGRVRVSATPLWAANEIIPRLPAFLDAHPEVQVDLVLADRQVDLVGGGIDVAIRSGDLPDSAMVARRIGRSTRMVVASPDLLARSAAPTPEEPFELIGFEAIGFTLFANQAWKFSRGTASQSVALSSRLTVDSAEALRAALVAGLGIGLVSRTMVEPELDAGVLTPLLPEWSLPGGDVHAVLPAGRRTTRRARAFVDHLLS